MFNLLFINSSGRLGIRTPVDCYTTLACCWWMPFRCRAHAVVFAYYMVNN